MSKFEKRSVVVLARERAVYTSGYYITMQCVDIHRLW